MGGGGWGGGGAGEVKFIDLSPEALITKMLMVLAFMASLDRSLQSHTASLAKWLRCPPRKQKVRSLNPICDGIFPGRVIPVTYKLATLPGAWRYRASAGTGWPGVSILCEVESLICNFFLSVAARKIV